MNHILQPILDLETMGVCARAQEVYLRNLGDFITRQVTKDASVIVMDWARLRAASVQEFWESCESPIEEILAAILPFCGTDAGYVDAEWGPPSEPCTVGYPQVTIGKHRVDFLVTVFRNSLSKSLAIECDGHEYHDRTKDQAARDKSRDRNILASGVTTIRFTGSELFRDPYRIQQEICELLVLMDRDLRGPSGTPKPPLPLAPTISNQEYPRTF